MDATVAGRSVLQLVLGTVALLPANTPRAPGKALETGPRRTPAIDSGTTKNTRRKIGAQATESTNAR